MWRQTQSMPSNRHPAIYFDEILKAIEKIDYYMGGISYPTFEILDEKQASVYYRLLVLTEAAHRLKPEELALCPGPNWRRLLDLGNVLRHGMTRLILRQFGRY
jgi:uncharacterized protein with HEPN domain